MNHKGIKTTMIHTNLLNRGPLGDSSPVQYGEPFWMGPPIQPRSSPTCTPILWRQLVSKRPAEALRHLDGQEGGGWDIIGIRPNKVSQTWDMDVEVIRRFTILASAVDHNWRAMEMSLKGEWVLPAHTHTLTCRFINNMACLPADETEIRIRPRFERLVADWMLSRERLGCAARDLDNA